MKRAATFQNSLMLAVLLLLVAVIQVKVSPVIIAVFEGLGIAFWAPVRHTIGIVNQFPLSAVIVLIGVVVCLKIASPTWKNSVLPGACLIVAIQLSLQITLIINFMAIVPFILARHNSTPTPQVTPTPAITLR